jgi:hypothetical protein
MPLRKGPKRKAGKHREPVHRIKKLPVKSRTAERKLEQQQAKLSVWEQQRDRPVPRELAEQWLRAMRTVMNPDGSEVFASAQRTN